MLFEATGRILVTIPRAIVRLCAVLLVAFASFGQSVQKHAQLYEMSASFHFQGFPEDVPLSPKPNYPSDLTDLTLEYFASGCHGTCPAFTLTIRKDVALFDGRAYLRAKGKRTAKVSPHQFSTFLHAWCEGNFYAMRDNYCDIRCPDGTIIVVTDIPESPPR